ncbi:MAG: TRAP transporter substrate-binding protein DctP [Rhodospirillales bacterium]|nr:TRAP transporter substrate-binding protein DctP [Rhodospirillales bacterium]
MSKHTYLLLKIKYLLLGATILLSTAASVQAQEYKWRIATFDGETGAYWNNFLVPFVDNVEKLTNGRMVLEPIPGGTLGSIFKIYEQVDDGLVEMAMMPPTFLGTEDMTNATILAFPTGLGVDSLLPWIYEGGGQDILKAHRAERMDMHAFVLGVGPTEIFAHSRKSIKETSDLAGLKYRTLGNWAAIVQEFFDGAPTTVPGAEIYGMLEKGGLDLTEYSTPSENMKRGYHEVADYIIYPGVHANAWGFEGVVKIDKWNELPADIQQSIEVAAQLATYTGFNKFIIDDLNAMQKLQQGDNTFVRLSDDFIAETRAAARTWALREAGKAEADGNPYPMQIYNSVTEFQDLWIENSKYMGMDYRP